VRAFISSSYRGGREEKAERGKKKKGEGGGGFGLLFYNAPAPGGVKKEKTREGKRRGRDRGAHPTYLPLLSLASADNEEGKEKKKRKKEKRVGNTWSKPLYPCSGTVSP